MCKNLLVLILSISFLGSFFGLDHKWTCNGTPVETSPEDPKIIIVGGGVSGVAAATRLVQNGFKNVKILEAENRLGGRVRTVAFGERYVDLGGHWIHGEEGNPVFKIASEMNLTTHSGDYENFIFVTDTGEDVPSGALIYEKIGEYINNLEALQNSTTNLYDYLIPRTKAVAEGKIKDNQIVKAILEFAAKAGCVNNGCDDLRDVSSARTADFKDSPGDFLTTWVDGGYNSIIEILLNKHRLSNGPPVDLKDVILNSEVTEIDWSGSEASVKCADGSIHKADHVIITVSLGVLKEKHSTLFNPPLPSAKLNAINSLGIGTIDKIYLHFPHQWWPTNVSGFGLLWKSPSEHAELTWEKGILDAFTESSAPNVLGMWIIGDNARKSEAQSEETVKEGCLKVLTKFLGDKYKIPPPTSVIRSQWYSNNHFRGSYSYPRMTSTNTTVADLAKPLTNSNNKQVLMFAGEATHAYFYSTVHGAMDSGWREADALIKIYKLNN